MELNREWIIKAFECCAGIPNCNDCPLRPYPQNCKDVMEKRAITLINELIDENEKLMGLYQHNSKLALDAEHKLSQCKNSYEDELSRVHMLLAGAWESVEQKDKLLGTIKADTVRKMQEKLKNYLREVADGEIGYGWIDQIAKEMLED